MLVTLFGIVMLVNPLQPWNAQSPMLVTLFGMVMLGSPSQSENAELPMLVTLFGMVMLVSSVQSQNAPAPMLVTPDSITTVFIEFLYEYHGLDVISPVPLIVSLPVDDTKE